MIKRCLLSKLGMRTAEGLLNLKDLLTLSPPGCRATFSGLVGWLKRGAADLLIPQGLMAKWARRTDVCMLNLKDLQATFPSKLKALFESEPAWRRSFCYQIVPNLTIFDQKRAANGREQADKGWIRGVFRDRLIKRRRQKAVARTR